MRLVGMNFETDGENEVLVGNYTVTITIEPFEDFISLFTFHWEPEVAQEADQFLLLDKPVRVLIEIGECLAHRGPLLPNLLDQLVLDVAIDVQTAGSLAIVVAFASLLLFHMLLETRIPSAVVPEDEAGEVVDLIAYPLTEVLVVERPTPILLAVEAVHKSLLVLLAYGQEEYVVC